jgi:hypothetical protein
MSINQFTAHEALLEIDTVMNRYLEPMGISKANALESIGEIVNRYLAVKPDAVETSALPVSIAHAEPVTWDRTRHFLAIAISAFSLPGRPGGQTIDAAATMLDALTAHGSPLAHLRDGAAQQLIGLTPAALRALAERHRQIDVEGFTSEHDDQHDVGALVCAAVCYASADTVNHPIAEPPDMWPWADEWWKPGDESRNLDKAAALLIAAGDRLDRESASTGVRATA